MHEDAGYKNKGHAPRQMHVLINSATAYASDLPQTSERARVSQGLFGWHSVGRKWRSRQGCAAPTEPRARAYLPVGSAKQRTCSLMSFIQKIENQRAPC